MKEARYFYVPDAPERNSLSDEEAAHALRVLRLKAGDEIFLMDGRGTFYRAVVTIASGKHCLYDIREALPQERPWQRHIHIAMAPTKIIDRTEWMAEKATEIGIDELTMIDCAFSERRTLRTDRLERIVIAAMKQSRKAWKPVVNGMTAFHDYIETPRPGRKFIAHCYEEIERRELSAELGLVGAKRDTSNDNPQNNSQTPEAITIMIGPEGDFSIDEVRMAVDHGYTSVSLGSSRLRTETAALYATMMARLSSV